MNYSPVNLEYKNERFSEMVFCFHIRNTQRLFDDFHGTLERTETNIQLWQLRKNTKGLFPVAVRMVHQCYKAVNIPIIGMGGISTPETGVDIPDSELAMWKETFPDKSMADLKKLYNETL